MKFSENWLREWVDPSIDTQQLVDQLTMAGLEVDAVEPVAGDFDGVVVARVLSVEPHPDAERLRVCQVDFGENEPVQIVCGASNVRENLKVPMAKVGAMLPGNFEIKKAKLRGVPSLGMLCSEKELGLAEQSSGLMELPDDAPVGEGVRSYLCLDDQSIEIDLTPNRSDCLSILGVARELSALNECEIKVPELATQPVVTDERVSVSLEAGSSCPRYVCRVVRDVDVKSQTPVWMVERLRRSGIRSLGPVVDVTNYVMLEMGQPMHAFDLDKLKGGIKVRMASPGECLTLLDGKLIELSDDSLVIADQEHPLALAGIMGGEASSVVDDTQSILLESAFFAPEIVAGKARRFGMHTESSHRFERGVDPDLQVRAMERATELLVAIAGGRAGPVVEGVVSGFSPKREPIALRKARIGRLLGIELDDDQVVNILRRLEMDVVSSREGWMVTPPAFRFDISLEADLIEELVRIYGYNKLPRTRPRYQPEMQPRSESERSLAGVRRQLLSRGYYEAISYSFVDPQWQKLLDPERQTIKLANPMSSEMSVMRTTLWVGLLKALEHNLNRQQQRVRLFETGLRFIEDENGLDQQPMIAGVLCGSVYPEQWALPHRDVDFFDVKGDIEFLLASAGNSGLTFSASGHPALHPGQSAAIAQNGRIIGVFGALHPQVENALGFNTRVFVFELELGAVISASVPAFEGLSKFPETRRDLAMVVDDSVTCEALLDAIRGMGSGILQDVQVFDVYSGNTIDSGKKSVALGLILQDFSRTLTDHDIDREVDRIISVLEQNFTAKLRV